MYIINLVIILNEGDVNMENICILGLSYDYIPPSSSFSICTNNLNIKVNSDIESIAKISCIGTGYIEETFNSLNKFYATVHVNFNIRIDYICNEKNMNFHIFELNKFIYINLGDKLNKTNFDIDVEILDIGVLSINKNLISLYTLLITCLY